MTTVPRCPCPRAPAASTTAGRILRGLRRGLVAGRGHRRRPAATSRSPPPTACPRRAEIDAEGYCTDCGDRQPRRRDRMELDLGGGRGQRPRPAAPPQRGRDGAAAGVVGPGRRRRGGVVCDGCPPPSGPTRRRPRPVGAAARVLLAAVRRRRRSDEASPPRPRGRHGRWRTPRRAAATATAGVHLRRRRRGGADVPSAGSATAGPTGWPSAARLRGLLTADDSAAEVWSRRVSPGAEAYAAPRRTPSPGGSAPTCSTRSRTCRVPAGGPGVVLVCSDGLWNYRTPPPSLAAWRCRTARPRRSRPPWRLVQKAASTPAAHDNITVVVVPFPVPGHRHSRSRHRPTRAQDRKRDVTTSQYPGFTVEIYQNQFLPEGGREVTRSSP